jgi:hypothetical protein
MQRALRIFEWTLGLSNYVVLFVWVASFPFYFGVNLPATTSIYGLGNAAWFSNGSLHLCVRTDQPLSKPIWFLLSQGGNLPDGGHPTSWLGDLKFQSGAVGDHSWKLTVPLPFILTMTLSLSLLYGWRQSSLLAWLAFLTVLGVELGFYVHRAAVS